MAKKKRGRRIAFLLLVVFMVMQLFRIDKTNPPVEEGYDFLEVTKAPQDVAHILKTSCYDCHSNTTRYPYYADIAPASWWIKHHIDEGREHLNFSEWKSYEKDKRKHKLEECIEEIQDGEMPLKPYLWMHSNAKMVEADKNKLIEWFEKKS